jgi:hypothetical protein
MGWSISNGFYQRKCWSTSLAALHRAASPCPVASARHGVPSWTTTTFCEQTYFHSQWVASSSVLSVSQHRQNSSSCPPWHILGCCNGILLLDERVVNPATHRWACLPPSLALLPDHGWDDPYLAFDPALLPHYKVVVIRDPLAYDKTLFEGSEWPPLLYTMSV